MSPHSPTTVSAGIAGTGVAAALVVILAWILSLCKVQMPPEVAVAVATVIGAVIHYFFRSPIATSATIKATPDKGQ